jgi:ferric hydroxamate/heme transport system permease protein
MLALDSLPRAPSRPKIWQVIAVAALVLLPSGIAASLLVGDVSIDPGTVYRALTDYDADFTSHVLVREWRLPRAVADVLVGAALAVAGAIMQAMTRNPLASPGIMGLNTGASFATVLAICYVPTAGRPELMLVSIAGAALGAALVYGLGSLSGGGLTPVRLALTGVAVSTLLAAIGNGFMIYNELGQDLTLWYARGTDNVQWEDVLLFLPFFAAGMLGTVMLAPTLGVMALGEHVAKGLGQRTQHARFAASCIVLVLAGGAVAVAGPVGFVGLMVPHIVRMLVGLDQRKVLPAAALAGALFLLVADNAARLATTPYRAAVPVGVVTSLLGVPFFLYLATRRATRLTGGSR